jgi:hypothetical protein
LPAQIYPLGITVLSGTLQPAAITAKLSTVEPLPTEAPIPTYEKLSKVHDSRVTLGPT